MRSKKIRFSAAILAILALGAVVTACGDSADNGAVTENAGSTTQAEAKDDPAAVYGLTSEDFGGKEFTFVVPGRYAECGSDWESFDIFAETITGDTVTDAVYERNSWIESVYNVKIRQNKPANEGAGSMMKNAIAAGDDVGDVLVESFHILCSMAQNGYLLDLKSVDSLDLSNTWWDQGAIEGVSIANKVYMATGDILIVDNDATWVLMFNKELAKNYDFDFYSMIDSGKWLFEDLFATARGASQDLNGDGKMKASDDQYGLVTAYNTPDALITAAGLTLSVKDQNDIPKMETDLARLSSVIAESGEFYADNKVVYGSDFAMSATIFQGGRALFYSEVLQCVTRMRESETDFGLIPWPKYDEAQDNYYSFMIGAAGLAVSVPTTQTDTHMTGVILDAMAAKSVDTLTVAYYNKALTQKYMRDETSIRMLDIILESRIFDQSHVYMYGWGNMYNKMVSDLKAGKNETASAWEKILPSAVADMEATIAAFQSGLQ